MARRAVCLRLIDSLYVMSMRIGFEMTRLHMTGALQSFFAAFSVHEAVGGEQRVASPQPEEGNDGITAAIIPLGNTVHICWFVLPDNEFAE